MQSARPGCVHHAPIQTPELLGVDLLASHQGVNFSTHIPAGLIENLQIGVPMKTTILPTAFIAALGAVALVFGVHFAPDRLTENATAKQSQLVGKFIRGLPSCSDEHDQPDDQTFYFRAEQQPGPLKFAMSDMPTMVDVHTISDGYSSGLLTLRVWQDMQLAQVLDVGDYDLARFCAILGKPALLLVQLHGTMGFGTRIHFFDPEVRKFLPLELDGDLGLLLRIFDTNTKTFETDASLENLEIESDDDDESPFFKTNYWYGDQGATVCWRLRNGRRLAIDSAIFGGSTGIKAVAQFEPSFKHREIKFHDLSRYLLDADLELESQLSCSEISNLIDTKVARLVPAPRNE